MMTHTFPLVERLVAQTLTLTTQLQHLLIKESTALQQHITPRELSNLLVHKQQIVNEINDCTQKLSQLFTAQSLTNPNDIAAYVAQATATGLATQALQRNWSALLALSAECKLLNEQNGNSIELLQRYTQRALYILKGNMEQPGIYGKDGNARSQRWGSTFLSA